MKNWFTKLVSSRLMGWAVAKSSREPNFCVGPKNDPYMKRWRVLPKNPFMNIYIHQFMHDDDDRALHDHPWASLSMLLGPHPLSEIYIVPEVYKKMQDLGYVPDTFQRELEVGSWNYRRPKFAHRIVIYKPGTYTLFLIGPRVREWGFYCPKGWKHWKKYSSVTNKGEIGVGCDDH
jgi:hypothetical protein